MGGGGRESGRNGSQNAKTRLEAAANSIAYFEAQTKRDTDRDGRTEMERKCHKNTVVSS